MGTLSRGFRLADAALQIYAETDVFEEERRPSEKRRSLAQTFLPTCATSRSATSWSMSITGSASSSDWRSSPRARSERWCGCRLCKSFSSFAITATTSCSSPSNASISFRATRADRGQPSTVSGHDAGKAKTRVKKAMRDMAEELLKRTRSGRRSLATPFRRIRTGRRNSRARFLRADHRSGDGHRDIKRDMEAATPMDRLLCGDVGYGKTEVAMRAAFKAVMDGKQVAFLAPTTVLAFQHLKTLRDRFAGFPVTIEMVSRFRTKQETKTILDDLAVGKVDVIVGTHRLLSKDVRFKDLGLLVVDEEQRSASPTRNASSRCASGSTC